MSVTQNPCPICDQPIADTAYACHRCARSLSVRLLRTSLLWRDLEDSLAGLGRIGARQSPPKPDMRVLIGPRCDDYACPNDSCYAIADSVARARTLWRAEPPLPHEDRGPLRLGDIAAKDDSANTFTTWARHISECRGEDIPSGPAMLSTLGYLARHADWLMHRQEAEQAYDELLHACIMVRDAVDSGAEQRYAGPCDVCGRDLYAAPSAAFVLCAPCSLEYPMEARRQWLLKASEDRLIPASELSRAVTGLGAAVTAETVRKWASRGRLVAHGHLGTRPLYRVGDVLDLLGEDARRQARSAV